MMIKLVLVLVLAAFTYGAPSSNDGRIQNGDVVQSVETYPFFASVEVDTVHVCGGFIYNEYYIVTAASCLIKDAATPPVPIPVANISVTVGLKSLVEPDPDEQRIRIVETIFYTEGGSDSLYNPVTRLHNIALLRLERQMRFGRTAKALIYNDPKESAPGVTEPAGLIGFGATEEGGLRVVELREALGLERLTNTECEKTYNNDTFNRQYMLCFGDTAGKLTPCRFDEGSPLFQLDAPDAGTGLVMSRAIGIASNGKGCLSDTSTEPAPPALYTRLSSYYAWLRQKGGQQPAYVPPAPGR